MYGRFDPLRHASARKDGGLTPAQLAWVLSNLALPETGAIPGNVAREELDQYRRDLVDRLLVLARPSRDHGHSN